VHEERDHGASARTDSGSFRFQVKGLRLARRCGRRGEEVFLPQQPREAMLPMPMALRARKRRRVQSAPGHHQSAESLSYGLVGNLDEPGGKGNSELSIERFI